MSEKTYLMIKPDGVERGLIGEIISRFENKSLKLCGMKMMLIPTRLAEKHYDVHKDKDFFPALIEFITSGPVVAMVWEGRNAIEIARKICGATSPDKAEIGTIRGDFVNSISANIIHSSDSAENAEREIKLFFSDDEIIRYNKKLSVFFN